MSEQTPSGEWQLPLYDLAYQRRQRTSLDHLARIAAGLDAATTGPLPIISAPQPAVVTTAAHVGSHRRPPEGLMATLMEHRGRFASFSVIGGGVFFLGLVMQVALVKGLRIAPVAAFFVQGFVSVQASFLANHYWTWRAQQVPFWRACWKFNASKILTIIANLALYALLVRLGVNYIAANVATTAVFTFVNYIAGHYWAFSSTAAPDVVAATAVDALMATTELEPVPQPLWPSVSVVVPCKDNATTIRDTVDALLGQHYPHLEEVILVGSTGDSTWAALADVQDPRLVLLEQEPTPGLRDPAVKRDKGIRKACGEVIALADSDIVMHSLWIAQGVTALLAQGGGVVAGGMRSIHDTFWGRFVDRNRLGAKTPRLPVPYVVTAENFGRRNRKPPVTANVILTRDVYESQALDIEWAYGYEDYEWFWRVAKAGHRILCTDQLTGKHHHRSTFRALLTEYKRSAGGCARFVLRHPDSPLARKRRAQGAFLPVTAVCALTLGAAAVAGGYGLAVAMTAATVSGALMIREFAQSRSAESLAYPGISLGLALTFTYVLSTTLMRSLITSTVPTALRAEAPTWPQPKAASQHRRMPQGRTVSLLALAVALGVVLRLWQLGSKPGWQVDEVTYTSLGRNLLLHGTLNLPTAYSQPWTPFLFHPPFYFLLLSRWFTVAGAGIYQARVLSVLSSTVTAILLARLVFKLHGFRAALVIAAFVATDGWLLYVQRISYIENTLFILIVGAFLAYRRALESQSWRWFAATGALVGAAAIFKHTGIYILPALAVHWIIVRRSHGKHLLLLGVALLIVAAYVFTMFNLFDYGGHNWYFEQTIVQVSRTLGLQKSKGTLTTPGEFLHLATQQYAVFLPSLLIALAGILWLARDLVTCARHRSFAPLGSDTILPAWAFTGVVIFGISSLRYAQYFSLVLIPLYAYLWTRVADYSDRNQIRPRTLFMILSVVMACGLTSFTLRVLSHRDNAFAQVRMYAWRQIPHDNIVVAESSIAYEIPEPWCSPYGKQLTAACQEAAQYVITWQTYLQSDNPFNSHALAHLLSRSSPVARFRGFNGTVIVWKVHA